MLHSHVDCHAPCHAMSCHCGKNINMRSTLLTHFEVHYSALLLTTDSTVQKISTMCVYWFPKTLYPLCTNFFFFFFSPITNSWKSPSNFFAQGIWVFQIPPMNESYRIHSPLPFVFLLYMMPSRFIHAGVYCKFPF